jgi:carboxylesterase type B
MQFFRSLDYIAGTVSVEGSLLYRKIMAGQLTRLVSDYETNLNFTIDTGIPFRVFKESIAPGVIQSFYGNNPNLTQRVCDFYSSHRGSMDQSNQIVKMYGDVAITTPTINALVAHSRNNTKSKTYQYLVSLVSPLPEGPPAPLWFGGCAHEDELYLLFRLMATPINLQMLDFHHDLSRKMIHYWANLAKTGSV